MAVYQGKGVYGAVAIGKASVFQRQAAAVRRVRVDDPAAELERIEQAKAKARTANEHLKNRFIMLYFENLLQNYEKTMV